MTSFLHSSRNIVSVIFLLVFLVPLANSQNSPRVPFHPPAGILVAGLRETETHRSPLPTLHIASAPNTSLDAYFWLHLNSAGKVIEVEDIQLADYVQTQFDSYELVKALSKITFQ